MSIRHASCQKQCQLALDYSMPEHSCTVGQCQYNAREEPDFAAALETAKHNKSFSNLARAYLDLLQRAQVGHEALSKVVTLDFTGGIKIQQGDDPWLRRVRDAANDLEPLRNLKVKR